MKNHHYQKLEFWEEFYQKQKLDTFEWYQSFNELWDIFRMVFSRIKISKEKFILDMGTGTSELLDNLYE